MSDEISGWTRYPDAEDDEHEEVFCHPDYGNIIKTNGKYYAMVPQIFSLGPFDDLKQAQRQVLLNYDVLLKLTRNFTPEMLKYIEDLRADEQFKLEVK